MNSPVFHKEIDMMNANYVVLGEKQLRIIVVFIKLNIYINDHSATNKN